MNFKNKIFQFLFFISLTTLGQSKILNNNNFNEMLDSLLAHTVNEISPEHCKKMDSILYLDAREKAEYEISHIQKSKWIGYNTFNPKKVSYINKNQKIVVYCTVGYRSEKIAIQLKKEGFTNVYNLYGGIFEWIHSGNKVYDAAGETQNVHTYDNEWGQWLQKGIKVCK